MNDTNVQMPIKMPNGDYISPSKIFSVSARRPDTWDDDFWTTSSVKG